jgi:hypothetical protein
MITMNYLKANDMVSYFITSGALNRSTGPCPMFLRLSFPLSGYKEATNVTIAQYYICLTHLINKYYNLDSFKVYLMRFLSLLLYSWKNLDSSKE